MKIVFLDAKTIGEDIDLSQFDELGEVVKYPFTAPEEVPKRVQDADVLIINKIEINEKSIHSAKNLKLVCVTATGTNNLDKDYLEQRGIAWRNVAGYSTESVAQHTFAKISINSSAINTPELIHDAAEKFGSQCVVVAIADDHAASQPLADPVQPLRTYILSAIGGHGRAHRIERTCQQHLNLGSCRNSCYSHRT